MTIGHKLVLIQKWQVLPKGIELIYKAKKIKFHHSNLRHNFFKKLSITKKLRNARNFFKINTRLGALVISKKSKFKGSVCFHITIMTARKLWSLFCAFFWKNKEGSNLFFCFKCLSREFQLTTSFFRLFPKKKRRKS